MSTIGKTPKEIVAAASNVWIDAQRTALDLMLSANQPGDPVDWGEGARWLTRIASLAQEWVVEYADPLRPTLFNAQGPTRKLMIDNPDVDYHFATLDDTETYRLSGNRGQAAALGISIGTDVLRGKAGATGTLRQCQLDDFEIDANGEFEVTLSKEPIEGNWIELPDGAAQITIRETFHDRRTERPAQMRVTRLGEALPVQEFTPQVAADRLQVAARWLLLIANTCVAMWSGFTNDVNRLNGGAGKDQTDAQRDEVSTHSAADMVYMGGTWNLPAGKALRITIFPAPGGARYWGITLINPWMESLDYLQRHSCTNDGLATPNADGSWTLVISGADPQAANWLDTGGREQGCILLRWVLAVGLPRTPECEVIDVQDA